MTRRNRACGIAPQNRDAMARSSQSSVPCAETAVLARRTNLSEPPEIIEASQRLAGEVGDTTLGKRPRRAGVMLDALSRCKADD